MGNWWLSLGVVLLLLPAARASIPSDAVEVTVGVGLIEASSAFVETSRDRMEEIGFVRNGYLPVRFILARQPTGGSFGGQPPPLWQENLNQIALDEFNVTLRWRHFPIYRFSWQNVSIEPLYFEQTAELRGDQDLIKVYSGPAQTMHIQCSWNCYNDVGDKVSFALGQLIQIVNNFDEISPQAEQGVYELRRDLQLRLTVAQAEARYAQIQSVESIEKLRMYANLDVEFLIKPSIINPSFDRALLEPIQQMYNRERERALKVVQEVQAIQFDLLIQAQRALELQSRQEESDNARLALQSSILGLVIGGAALLVASAEFAIGRAWRKANRGSASNLHSAPTSALPSTEWPSQQSGQPMDLAIEQVQ